MFDKNIGLEFPVTVYGNLEKYNEKNVLVVLENVPYHSINVSTCLKNV